MFIAELGRVLKKRRKTLKITQADLAELAGVNTNTIIRIENGQISPGFDTLSAISDVLGMEIKLTVKQIGNA
jgi:y4mF family transcriptional regulator